MRSFLSVHEAGIREHFTGLKTLFDAQKKNGVVDDPEDSIRSQQKEIIHLLEQHKDIKELESNKFFCKTLVNVLFPPEIIQLLGGYEKLLALPPFDNTHFKNRSEGDYVRLSENSVSDIAIGLLPNSFRPFLALKVTDGKNNFELCWHARYGRENVSSNWVRGDDSLFHYGESLIGSELKFLQLLLKGERASIDDHKIMRPSAYLTMNDAATKIQAAYRNHRVFKLEKELERVQAELTNARNHLAKH